jgi:hypothetical protein
MSGAARAELAQPLHEALGCARRNRQDVYPRDLTSAGRAQSNPSATGISSA